MTEQDEPIARVAKVLLETSLKENASMVSISRAADKVNVSYRTDAWHAWMTMPDYVWAPLRDHLAWIIHTTLEERASYVRCVRA